MISRNTIDRVFESARVEEVIGEFVQLKKAGSNLRGFSPFADEKSPSFMVSPVKQIWKDFSTGKGGTAVSFLMEHEHYSYPEAIRWLAKKYNIEIEETEQTDEQKQQMNERESMFLVSKFAKDYFHDLMFNSSIGKAIGLSYFKERGFREETIKKFDLGYCLDEWDAFTKAALEKGYELKHLALAGLTIVKEDLPDGKAGKRFDRFKGRVMFPIHSMSGRILGFGGRILTNDKKAAKYLNSPESEIYHKSKILYGIYQAKKEIAKQDNCFLVEGYTDVISFHQSGIENVVASSGTALTSDQIRLVNRLTKNITVLFDGDAAGIRASIRGIDLILEQGMNVKVVQFPDGEDPDSFAKAHSDIELKEYLENSAQDFINFKVSLLLEDAKDDPVKKAALIRDIVTSISKIPDGIKREIYVKECAKIMDISERVLFSELAQIIAKNNTEEAKKQQATQKSFDVIKQQVQFDDINQLELIEKGILSILILFGNEIVDFIDWKDTTDDEGNIIEIEYSYSSEVSREIFLKLQDDEIEFTNDFFKYIYYELINQLNQNDKIDIDYFTKHNKQEVSNFISGVILYFEKETISNWERKGVYVNMREKKENISQWTYDVISKLRLLLIEKFIDKENHELLKLKDENNSSIYQEKKELIFEYAKLSSKISTKKGRVTSLYYS